VTGYVHFSLYINEQKRTKARSVIRFEEISTKSGYYGYGGLQQNDLGKLTHQLPF